MTSIFRTRAVLALIVVLTLGTRLAYYASNPRPQAGPWLSGAIAHNIVSDGHWFQFNANAGPRFAFDALPKEDLRGNDRPVAPSEVDLKYADAHPRWVPFVAEPVGEAVLLAGLWKAIGSQDYLPDILMRIALDVLAALLVYRIAMLLFRRRRAALTAGVLYALYPPIAQLVVSPVRDFWSIDFTIFVLAAYLEAINSKRPGRWLLACGVLTGIGAYFDSGILILPGALALASVPVAGWRTTLRRALVPTAIAVLLLVPWTIRNYDDYHTFVPIRIGLGTNLWSSLIQISHFGTSTNEIASYQLLRRTRPDLHWLTPAYDSYLRQRAFEAIERHPLFYLKILARNVWRSTLGALDAEWMRGGTKTPFAYPRGPIAYAIEKPFQLLQVMLMPLVFLLAMLSLGFTWARHKPAHLILIAATLANALPYIVIHVEPRYMLPLAISYLIWIGLGSDLLLERLSLRRAGRRERSSRGALAA
jgi:4-amino-4-deoxy-L-arabinose transferase-like glycosyltransferase